MVLIIREFLIVFKSTICSAFAFYQVPLLASDFNDDTCLLLDSGLPGSNLRFSFEVYLGYMLLSSRSIFVQYPLLFPQKLFEHANSSVVTLILLYTAPISCLCKSSYSYLFDQMIDYIINMMKSISIETF